MTSHASRRTAHPGRSSSFYKYMATNIYTKRPFSLQEQVIYLLRTASVLKTLENFICLIVTYVLFSSML